MKFPDLLPADGTVQYIYHRTLPEQHQAIIIEWASERNRLDECKLTVNGKSAYTYALYKDFHEYLHNFFIENFHNIIKPKT